MLWSGDIKPDARRIPTSYLIGNMTLAEIGRSELQGGWGWMLLKIPRGPRQTPEPCAVESLPNQCSDSMICANRDI